jgi:general stress protein 26
MAPKLDEGDGTIRFLTSVKTHKIQEAQEAPLANAAFSNDDGDYISVSGRLRVSEDERDIEAVWTSAAELWLKEGKAEAAVLILEPEIAEYWDSQNTMKAGWEMIKGALSDRQPHPGEHGKVQL